MSVTDRSLDGLSDEARTLWAAALGLNRAAGGVSLPPLLIFTDPVRTPSPWTIAAHLPAGAGIVYRHFGAPDRIETAQRLREITRSRDVRLLIGMDFDLAEQIDADGLHLPDRSRNTAAEVRARRPDWIITAAAHIDGPDRAPVDAHLAGLDALILSPVFETNSPSPSRCPLGVEGLAEIIRRAKLPIYALGGIGSVNVESLAHTGTCGIAGVSAFAQAFNPDA